MRKSIIKRVRKLEQRTFQPRWRVVTKDYDGLYRGECGDGLGQEQFDAWVKQQDKDTQVIIVEVCENVAPAEGKQEVTFKVENHVDKNTADFLKGYDEIIQFSRSAETEINSESVEAQVLAVNPNCDRFSDEQAKLIAHAQEIIRNAPIH